MIIVHDRESRLAGIGELVRGGLAVYPRQDTPMATRLLVFGTKIDATSDVTVKVAGAGDDGLTHLDGGLDGGGICPNAVSANIAA